MSAKASGPLSSTVTNELARALALNQAASTIVDAARQAGQHALRGLELPRHTFYRLTLATGDAVIASDGTRMRNVRRELLGKFVVGVDNGFEIVDAGDPYPDLLRFYPLRWVTSRLHPQAEESRIAIGLPGELLRRDSADFRLQPVSSSEIYAIPRDRFADIEDLNRPLLTS